MATMQVGSKAITAAASRFAPRQIDGAFMDTFAGNVPVPDPPQASIEAAVRDLPDGCACTVAELADRVGIDKLVLLRWTRTNVRFALLAASKVRP